MSSYIFKTPFHIWFHFLHAYIFKFLSKCLHFQKLSSSTNLDWVSLPPGHLHFQARDPWHFLILFLVTFSPNLHVWLHFQWFSMFSKKIKVFLLQKWSIFYVVLSFFFWRRLWASLVTKVTWISISQCFYLKFALLNVCQLESLINSDMLNHKCVLP